MATNILEVIFRGTDEISGVVDVVDVKISGLSAKLKGLFAGGDDYSEAGSTWKDTLNTLTEVGAGALPIVKQLWELGKMGAIANDIEDAFIALAARIGDNNDVMAQMRSIVKGTVDETDIMAVMLSTLSGSAKELQGPLLEAQPALMELARGLYKVNPMLGTSAQIYGQLNQGVKLHREGMLESQGIMVDYKGEAIALAKSLDKKRDALNDAELSQAMLNAVLKAGAGYISNLDGNLESSSDSFNKFGMMVDGVKGKVGQGIADVVNEIDMSLQAITSMRRLTKAAGLPELIQAMDEYNEAAAAAGRTHSEINREAAKTAWLMWQEGLAIHAAGGSLDEWAAGLRGTMDVIAPLAGQQSGIAAQGTAHGTAYADAFNAAVNQGIDVNNVAQNTAILVFEQLVGTDTSGMALP